MIYAGHGGRTLVPDLALAERNRLEEKKTQQQESIAIAIGLCEEKPRVLQTVHAEAVIILCWTDREKAE